MTTKIVGKDGGNWWIESWMDAGSMAFGYLFVVGSDKTSRHAARVAVESPAD